MIVSHEDLLEKLFNIYPFNLSTLDSLKEIIEKLEIVYFESGNLIYLQGAPATNFFVIYEGEVETFVEKSGIIKKLNNLHEGDYFGEEALNLNDTRTSSARVTRNSLLIKIPKNLLLEFCRTKPELEIALALISHTYSKLLDFKFNGLPTETVHFLGQPHAFFLVRRISFSLLFLFISLFILTFLAANKMIIGKLLWGSISILVGLLIVRLMWIYQEWKNDIFVMTNRRVINLQKHIINYDSKFEIPLSAINHLEIKKSLFGREIDFGDLIIRTFTGETLFKDIAMPSAVQFYLEYLIKVEKLAIRNDERKSFEEIVSKRIFSENSLKLEINNNNFTSEGDNPRKQPVLIYHTHWIILLKKVIFPLSGIISFILFLVFFLLNQFSFIKFPVAYFTAGFLIAGLFLWLLYQFFDWKNDQYHICQNQVIDFYRRPFGTENKRTASIQNIQSIRFERKGFLGRLLNFGTVYIRVGDEELTFDNVPKPDEIQEKLFHFLELFIASIKKSDLTDQQMKITEWIETYDRVKKGAPRKTSNN